MKIGIITLSASDNCGSLLQTFALKNALKKYGDVEVINFTSKESRAIYDATKYKGIKKIFYRKKSNLLKKESKDYILFRRDYIGIKGKEYFPKELSKISEKYDVVVTGSDQVWNVKMGDFNEAFFLGWTHSKKVAYAPSLGGRHLNVSDNFDRIKGWLNDFSYISVREEIGKKCLEEVTGKNIPKVLDPTLIVEEGLWNEIVDQPLIKGDYIFYYSWAYCDDATSKIVSDAGEKMSMPVYVIDARKWVERDYQKWNFNLFESTGPHIFLNLMKYAKICYVESFHGMVFAYIFRKNYWLLDTHRDLSELDSRLMEFVNVLDAKDRILTEYNCNNIDQTIPVEYGKNDVLEDLRKKSWEYLDRALGETME